MVEKLGFASPEEAAALRNPYFAKYHSSFKAMTVAAEEGKLPPLPDGSKRGFVGQDLSDYFAENCDYGKYITLVPKLVEVMTSLKQVPGLTMVAFTNAPRKYGIKCLEALGLAEVFAPELIYAVDDVAPHCKPEAIAFEKVLDGVKSVTGDHSLTMSNCIMFEDSMKNIKGAKAMGMGTVLILCQEGLHDTNALTDAGDGSDEAVDAVLRVAEDMQEKLPMMWQRKFVA